MTLKELKAIIYAEGNFHVWKSSGLTCVVYRFLSYGHWCGYVGLSKSHKLYGKDYGDLIKVPKKIINRKVDVDKIGVINLLCVDKKNLDNGKLELGMAFDAHGGITFAGELSCWKLDNKWFIGFDTAHAGDMRYEPDFNPEPYPGDVYRTKEYTIKETENLAKQLSIWV